MIAIRLVRLIEKHSDELTDGLLTKFQSSSRTRGLASVPTPELRSRSNEILRNLSDWLLHSSEMDIERRYREIGSLRAVQNVPLADVCWAIVLTKEHIWDFLQRQGFLRGPLEIFGEMELFRLLDQFFDRAVCYCAQGYQLGERSRAETAATSAVSSHPRFSWR